MKLFAFSAAFAICAGIMETAAFASPAVTLEFQTHAAFFSAETNLATAPDPQAFVAAPDVAAGIGPQNIAHAAGIRPAFIAEDRKSTPLLDAKAKPLGFSLEQWLDARGQATIKPEGAGALIVLSFKGLRPRGHYSLFENHFDQKPVSFTPLDGKGIRNNFIARTDGSAQITVKAPEVPTHVNAILLVYHSDNHFHGTDRGKIGVNAHHQLIARPD